MTTSATPNQMWDIIVQWHGDATDAMEIDLLDLSYSSDHYVTKIPSGLANINTGLIQPVTAMEKLVSELVTRHSLAKVEFPGLIAQYWPLLEKSDAIYKLSQEDKPQVERMLYNQYSILEHSSQNLAAN
jgi:hypothetical protein